jgi:arylsulfatase A-like enzyme
MDVEQRVPQVPFSWNLTYAPVGQWRTPWRAFFGFAGGEAYNTASLPKADRDAPRLPYEAADVPDNGYPDGLHAEEAVKQLRDLKQRGSPFLLAIGFYKPHLPFNAPKRYWDLYPRDLPLAPNPFPPSNTNPAISLHPSSELTGNHYWPGGSGKVTEDDARALRHGYYACVSYIDAQVGKVLSELKRLGLDSNTVVVLWSDHGWHLGEHGIFGKQTNHEIAVRSPLIVRMPCMPRPGQPAQGLAETVDLYPTLAGLCGLRAPADLRGTSLFPLIRDPEAAGREFAFSHHPRGRLLGRTLRTQRYRLVYWTDQNAAPVQTELYDHQHDPGENLNVAAANPAVAADLIRKLPPLPPIE